jgi:two-component system, OmpR family, sensor histidine kinase KdpD
MAHVGFMRQLRHPIVALGLALAGIALVVVTLGQRAAVNPTTASLALLLVVLGTAALSPLWVAVAAAVVSAVAFNFFFLPPVGTLTIADAHNWIALGTYLIVAVVASQLSATARARAREATARGAEVTRL